MGSLWRSWRRGRWVWEGRESSALALSPRGCVPLDSRLFGVMGGQNFSPCLADTLRRDDRPPTHFSVKKKFSPVCGAETTTQNISSVLCYAHTLCGVKRYATLGIKEQVKRSTKRIKTPVGAGSILHPQGSFFLYEKSGLRESDCLRGRRKEVCADSTPPFPALKKTGIQGESLPLGGARGRASRSCPSSAQRSKTGSPIY